MTTPSNSSSPALRTRYRGSVPFQDDDVDRLLFRGRSVESQSLLNEILAVRLNVLYAKSGVGKTSLLNAGVFSGLREKGFFPISIRLNEPDEDVVHSVIRQVETVCERAGLEVESKEKGSFYDYFQTTELWSEDDALLTPVLIFDQFEEIFTLHNEAGRAEFFEELATIATTTARRDERLPPLKIVISMREDFVAELEGLADAIPEIRRHRFRLLPLGRKQAEEAIIGPAEIEHEDLTTPPLRYEPEAVEALLDFLCDGSERSGALGIAGVEPVQLQILCRHYAEKAGKDNLVTREEIGDQKAIEEVLRGFYEVAIANLSSSEERAKARRLCHNELISQTGRRLSVEEGELLRRASIKQGLLHKLVDARILRSEPRVGSVYYELSHDTLIIPIQRSERMRKRARRRHQYEAAAVAGGILIAALSLFAFKTYKEDAAAAVNDRLLKDYSEKIQEISDSCGELGAEASSDDPAFCRQSLVDRHALAVGLLASVPILKNATPEQVDLQLTFMEHANQIQKDQVEKILTMREKYNEYRQDDDTRSAPIARHLMTWRYFMRVFPGEGDEQWHALKRLSDFRKMPRSNVLVTCKNIGGARNSECYGVADRFEPGATIWAWASVDAPVAAPETGASKVKIAWYKRISPEKDGLRPLETSVDIAAEDPTAQVIRAGAVQQPIKGQRVINEPGDYEVHLESEARDSIRTWSFKVCDGLCATTSVSANISETGAST